MKNKLLALVVVLTMAVGIGQVFAAPVYVPGQTTTAYSYVHGGYVGKAVVMVKDDGSLDIEIDEAFLPHTLSKVDLKADEWTEDNTVHYVLRGKKNHAAKYIEYDGTVYVGTTVGESLTYVKAGESGEAVGGKDLELLILKNQGTMAAYFENLKSGGFKIFTEFNGTAQPVTTTGYGTVFKDSSEYWTKGQTWKGNINAIEEFIEQNGSAYPLSGMSRAKEKNEDGLKLWSVVDAVTGATNVDFKDYFAMVQLAIAQLEMK